MRLDLILVIAITVHAVDMHFGGGRVTNGSDSTTDTFKIPVIRVVTATLVQVSSRGFGHTIRLVMQSPQLRIRPEQLSQCWVPFQAVQTGFLLHGSTCGRFLFGRRITRF
jgi:hypothetical protein